MYKWDHAGVDTARYRRSDIGPGTYWTTSSKIEILLEDVVLQDHEFDNIDTAVLLPIHCSYPMLGRCVCEESVCKVNCDAAEWHLNTIKTASGLVV